MFNMKLALLKSYIRIKCLMSSIEIRNASPANKLRGKRFEAIVRDNGTTKVIAFGQLGGQTYVDHQDRKKRAAYIARHSVREDYSKINPGSLSRYILWSEPTIEQAAAYYSRRFRIPVVLKL